MNPIFRAFLTLFVMLSVSTQVWAERPSPGEGRTGLIIFGVLVVVMMGVAVAMSLIRKEGVEEDDDDEEEEDEQDESQAQKE